MTGDPPAVNFPEGNWRYDTLKEYFDSRVASLQQYFDAQRLSNRELFDSKHNVLEKYFEAETSNQKEAIKVALATVNERLMGMNE